MEGNRLSWVIVLYVIAMQILPQIIQLVVFLQKSAVVPGVMS